MSDETKCTCAECTSQGSNFPLSDCAFDYLLEKRKLFLIGEITEEMSAFICMNLQFFAQSNEPAYLYICSPGGDLFAGYAIIDQMELSPFPIYTIVRGQAASMGAIVAAHGMIGHRYITDRSSMMIHPISIMPSGEERIEDHKNRINFYEKFYKKIIKRLAKRINVSYNKLSSAIADTTWMDSRGAIDLGLVDHAWTKKLEAKSC